MLWDVIADGGADQAPDIAEVRRALGVLLDPAGAHEIRGLPSGRSRLVRPSDPDAAVAAILDLASNRGVYYTLNPVRPDLGDRAARKNDVLRRINLLIDIDPVKGDPDGSSTETEKDAARKVAMATLEDLAARGWPAPAIIDSGNGFHLVYRIDLPNNALARQWVSACLKALAARHDTDAATIDVKVHDAPRISKLPGTWARKGSDMADRPHRVCRLLNAPAPFLTVPLELIRDLAGPVPETSAVDDLPPKEVAATDPIGGVKSPWGVRATNSTLAAYIARAIASEAGRVALAPEGDRNTTLNDAAFRLGTLLHSDEASRADIEADLLHAARRAGLREIEARKTIRSGLDAGAGCPRDLPEPQPYPTAKVRPKADPATLPERLTIRASEIVPKVVRWLWRDRVPLDFVTVFAGRTGLGKSFVVCDLAARLTRGDDPPSGTCDLPGECHNVLFISEDPYEYVLAPRLLELEADMDRISFLRWEVLASYTMQDLEFLERAYHEAGDPILIAIDPPTNFLGGADEHKNAEVRAVLTGLVAWLNGRNVACILITHVNKNTGKGIEALNRVLGSVAWTTTSRVAMSFAPDPDPDQPGRCLFTGMKNNLGETAKTLAYRIVKTDTLARIEWLGEVDISADEAMAGERREPRKVVASDWLIAKFRQKLRWFSDDLFALAKQEGVSRNAIFEAKKDLALPSCQQDEMPGGKKAFVWWVPPDWPLLNAGQVEAAPAFDDTPF